MLSKWAFFFCILQTQAHSSFVDEQDLSSFSNIIKIEWVNQAFLDLKLKFFQLNWTDPNKEDDRSCEYDSVSLRKIWMRNCLGIDWSQDEITFQEIGCKTMLMSSRKFYEKKKALHSVITNYEADKLRNHALRMISRCSRPSPQART